MNIKNTVLEKTSIVTFLFIVIVFAWVCGQLIVNDDELAFPVLIETSTTCRTTATANDSSVHFGASGYQDFTQQEDPQRKQAYQGKALRTGVGPT